MINLLPIFKKKANAFNFHEAMLADSKQQCLTCENVIYYKGPY